MKTFATMGALALSSALVAGPALAGGLNPPVEAPVVTPVIPVAPPAPVVADWSGFYAGLSYGKAMGDANIYDDGDPAVGPLGFDGELPGLFAGYNMQRGNLVFGGELAAGLDAVEGDEDVGDAHSIDNVIDLKGRVGYAFGNLLAYGALGYSMADYTFEGENASVSGLGYGVGAEYQFGGRYFAGLEYYSRDLSGEFDNFPSSTVEDTNFDTVSLRVGMQF